MHRQMQYLQFKIIIRQRDHHMKSVLIFPTDEVRDWVTIERRLRVDLKRANASTVAQEEIIGVMKVYWQTLNQSGLYIKSPNYTEHNLSNGDFQESMVKIKELNEQIYAQQQTIKRKSFLERLMQEIDISKEQGKFY